MPHFCLFETGNLIYFLLFFRKFVGAFSFQYGKNVVMEMNPTSFSVPEDGSRTPLGKLVVFMQKSSKKRLDVYRMTRDRA